MRFPRRWRCWPHALNCADGPQGLYDLCVRLKVDMALSNCGFSHDNVEQAVSIVMNHERPNPRGLDRGGLTKMFADMVDGRRPA
ncbi:MAG: hypothetical protein ACI8PT_003371 [Gammaproteobacteria bacterium]|jgi:hypothetical protein